MKWNLGKTLLSFVELIILELIMRILKIKEVGKGWNCHSLCFSYILFSKNDIDGCEFFLKNGSKLDITIKGTFFSPFKNCVVCVWWWWWWWPLNSHLWMGMSTKCPTNLYSISWLHPAFMSPLSHTHPALYPTLQGEPWSSVSRQKSVVTCFIIVVLCQLENKLSLPDGSMLQKMC